MNYKAKRIFYIFLPSLCFIGFFTCNHSRITDESPTIAKVGNSLLTLNDLKSTFPKNSDLVVSDVQIQRYIQQWIESELIYQEAIKRKIHLQLEVQKRTKEMERDIVVGAFIDQFIDQDLDVKDDEIEKYYSENSSEFVRPENQYHLQIILVKTLEDANNVRKRINYGEDFVKVAKEVSLDASNVNGGDIKWISLQDLPDDISNTIPLMSVNVLSRPKKTAIGYYVIKILEIRLKGEMQLIEEVKDTIVWRIKATKRGEKYHRLITLLTENAATDINWNSIQNMVKDLKNDTTRNVQK
jgi:hypothetical protein